VLSDELYCLVVGVLELASSLAVTLFELVIALLQTPLYFTGFPLNGFS
jgi:hypothetical protein